MSRITYKLSDLHGKIGNVITMETSDILGNFIDTIKYCGNDTLEIICDIDISKNTLDLINRLHLTDKNKTVKFIFKKEDLWN